MTTDLNPQTRREDHEPLPEIDMAWLEVAEQRYRAYLDGKEKGIPAEQVFAELRKELGIRS